MNLPGNEVELAVVVPTFNERDNLIPLLEALEAALVGIQHEVMFVDDDSPDGTADTLREIGLRFRPCGSCKGLAGEAYRPPVSKACWQPPRLTSP